MSGEQAKGGDRRLLDKPGFAQEFLRRDSIAEREVMARRWGLCFPLRAFRLRRC
jgi:hypothetical protein